MCSCNEEDYPCLDCIYRLGKEDALDGIPYDPEYKNWNEVNAYEDGYKQGLIELEQKI